MSPDNCSLEYEVGAFQSPPLLQGKKGSWRETDSDIMSSQQYRKFLDSVRHLSWKLKRLSLERQGEEGWYLA